MSDALSNLFPSFSVTFKNQEDFDAMAQIRESFDVIDISWSERIFNFDSEDERNLFLDVCTSKVYSIDRNSLELNED